ncbi:MAG: hypothetical protein IPL83_11095 [Bdellovibrionales bacterium]|nr:hypothetical protein [Bdellovibrionales bacterium]
MIKCIIAKAFESTLVFTGRDGVLGKLELSHFGISGLLPSSFLVLVLALVFGVCVQSLLAREIPATVRGLNAVHAKTKLALRSIPKSVAATEFAVVPDQVVN